MGSNGRRVLRFAMSFVVLATVLVGCGTVTVRVPVMRPAEINLRGKSELVLGDVVGEDAARVEGELKSAIAGSGRFKLVDRRHLDRVMHELEMSASDLADTDSRRKLGRLMTGSILIAGTVERHGYEEDYERSHQTCSKMQDGKKVEFRCVVHQRHGSAEVIANFDVVDIETGENLRPKRVNCRRARSTQATDQSAPRIDGGALLEECVREAVSEFMKAIAPWQDHVNAKFQKDSKLPAIARGISHAQRGQWDDAVQAFESAVQQAEQQGELAVKTVAKAYWNLGLAYQYTNRFELASQQVKKAYEMTQNTMYLNELDAIETLRRDHLRLQEQLAEDKTS